MAIDLDDPIALMLAAAASFEEAGIEAMAPPQSGVRFEGSGRARVVFSTKITAS